MAQESVVVAGVRNGVAEHGGVAKAVVFTAPNPHRSWRRRRAPIFVQFYKAAFGAEELKREMHTKRKAEQGAPSHPESELKVGSSQCSSSPITRRLSPLSLEVHSRAETNDVEGAVSKAVKAGAIAEGEITEGENATRVGRVKDPYGYVWLIRSAIAAMRNMCRSNFALFAVHNRSISVFYQFPLNSVWKYQSLILTFPVHLTRSHDGRHLSFGIRGDEEDNSSGKLRVWVADVETGVAQPLFKSPDVYLNAVFDNYVWVDNSTLLVCTIPLSRKDPPPKPLVPSGPKIQSNEQKNVIQLVLASLDGKVKPIGPAAVYTSLDPSPDEKYILISSIHRPYSFIVPCGRFPKKVDVWTTEGKFVRELCDLPLAEDIPIAFNSVRKGMRSINWRADKPSTLYWVETQDGGDAKVEVSPRDIVYSQPAELQDDEQPEILHKLDLRYGGISWCDDSLALVYESWYKTRRTRTWVISPGLKDSSPRILFDRSSEDVYSDPGSPMLRRTPAGTYIIAKIKRENDPEIYLLLNGSGATPEGNIPFLDLFNINTGEKERIWESDKEKYYETVVALMSDQSDGDIHVDQLKILISKESKTENTQYQRKDGVQLTATLYLPPGYDPSKDGPLPCLVWSYPGEFKSKDAAGQVRGFAILSGPTIPIIGEGDEEANDRYVEQLVASAEAAVEEVVRRGIAHPNKIAIGGHSYGAFMTANLLAHAPHLFCCGIARSGAYNRTLTPFGFQNEDRTLWEATNTYVEMSPFMSANKIKRPILLIHGEEDNNPGTLTMQSDRFFNALKGHGALCRLVVLPYESHGYASRESIMHVLWETDRWLQKYCVSASNVVPDVRNGKDEPNEVTDISDNKAVPASGGGSAEGVDREWEACQSLRRASLWYASLGKYFLFFEISAGLDRTFTKANVREHEEQFDAYRMR
ncbi:hypothetical protein Syun_008072 [Stephania yunnanensis]|uniref:Probable glutamyl endopeptidase, chloroplastic n=1 Tax=Stephania yunnanensis TaxID=152371 RepID=A0AAP0KZW7_9MAGN